MFIWLRHKGKTDKFAKESDQQKGYSELFGQKQFNQIQTKT